MVVISDVYGCLLDASKAFDRVHYGKLFRILLSKKMPILFCRWILDSYLQQSVCVMWDSCKSEYFKMYNDVKPTPPILTYSYLEGIGKAGWSDFMSFI